jgi:RNA polymerase sigma-70 factor (ECF subfamily)
MLLVRDEEIARDIVQEAFVRLWQSPRTPRDPAGFKGWLYKTVTNLSRDHQRRSLRWGRIARLMVPSPPDPEQALESRFTNHRVAVAIAALSRGEREALYLRYFEDAPFEKVAEMLGKTQGATRVLVHRALRKIRAQLGSTRAPEANENAPR